MINVKLYKMHFSPYSYHNSPPLFCYYQHPYRYLELYLCESLEHSGSHQYAVTGIQTSVQHQLAMIAPNILEVIIMLLLLFNKLFATFIL
jgi:hypothetical protein